MKITHGLGGPRGILTLVVTCVAGVVGMLGIWLFRENINESPRVPTQSSPAEILHQAGGARGPKPEVPYIAKDLARVASFGIGQFPEGQWRGLPEGTVLQVAATTMEAGELWVKGVIEGGTSRDLVKVHSSFLERYTPVSLDNTVELSDVRLVHEVQTTAPKTAVTGWLRNISSQTLSQCTVVCTFQARGGPNPARQHVNNMVLRPLEFVRFATPPAAIDRATGDITLQISHAAPDGLRQYLPAVVIPRSSGQRAQ
ncbi:MAG TPA: hypothetical protein VMP11_01635 [Verrucomicrobiae bacterium]|nr:hypothetical protein [Verrucomicrobiae bacterium]